jgi:hypothetical protein
MEYLNEMPVIQLVADYTEADDVIALVINHTKYTGWRKTIISSDKDFFQLCRDDVQVYRPIQKAKTKLFAWLYNEESQSIQSDFYDRESLKQKFYRDGKVETPFGRSIAAPVRKALNYLLQSSSSDNTLDRFCKISNFLRSTRSHVAFVVHDSVVIDLHKDDRFLIPQLVEMFGDTKLGKFKVNCSMGKNLGDMREFKW